VWWGVLVVYCVVVGEATCVEEISSSAQDWCRYVGELWRGGVGLSGGSGRRYFAVSGVVFVEVFVCGLGAVCVGVLC